MSLYVTWINLIKESADEEWLTDSQREVYERIISRWQSHSFVNLYGHSGGGKTFIARLLAKKHAYVYTHDLNEVPEGAKQVVLDNARYTRMMRPILRELNLGRILLITQNAVAEAMPKIELKISEKDVCQVLAALSNHCGIIFTQTEPEGVDLAEIIRKEVVKRGETYVNQ